MTSQGNGDIGLVGLGQMGSAISRHFLTAGWRVRGLDLNAERLRDLTLAGGQAAGCIADLAGCPIVVTVLWDDAITRSVAEQLAETLSPGAIHVAMGTISTSLASELHRRHGERGQRYLSAPVFGRPEAARAAALTVMCAGDSSSYEEVEPLLGTLGTARWIGPHPFQANLMKVTGNAMIFAAIELLGEMFALLRKAGVSEADAKAAIVDPLFASPIFSGYATRIMQRQWMPAAGAFNLAKKDNDLCLAAAADHAVAMPIVALMAQRIAECIEAGDEHMDISAIARRSAVAAGLDA
jgi:hypothetical protein